MATLITAKREHLVRSNKLLNMSNKVPLLGIQELTGLALGAYSKILVLLNSNSLLTKFCI